MMDARAVRAWLALAVSTAESTRPLVDSLNVFPVPDADTGTNVVLTLRSATDALRLLPGGADLLQVTRALADGAVRGALGNSRPETSESRFLIIFTEPLLSVPPR